jgi:GntR family transcriptional regulator / MocR family aminotransferase
MEPMFELGITLPARRSRERRRSLHGQLRAAIIDGRLKPGLRLPPTREMAAAHRVSRNTVVAAYELLLTEGYLSARRGAGTFVAQTLPRRYEAKAGAEAVKATGRASASARSADGRGFRAKESGASIAANDPRLNAYWRDSAPVSLDPNRTPPRFDFRLGKPDRQRFPFDIWRRLYTRSLRALSKAPNLATEVQGRERLRVAIARHVSFTRAVACSPENIVVTTGAQQAVDLLARVLVTSGRTTVAVEDPGYPPARGAFAAAGAKLAVTPVDEEGLVVSRLSGKARVVYVTPSHQFPLGSVMSMERRVALLNFARARGAVIIEDDYDGEFRFGGRPLDALQTLDQSECVFYVGTFSKSLFPAVRVGYLVAPPWARNALVAARQLADGNAAIVTQDALADFISEGHLARHVRKMRQIYGARRQALLAGLAKLPGGWLAPVPSHAGLHLAAFTPAGLDTEALEIRARERGVSVRALKHFYLGKPGRHGLAFGLGLIEERDIEPALAILQRLRHIS